MKRFLVIAFALLSLGCAPAVGQSKDLRARLEKEIKMLDSQIRSVKAKTSDLLSEMNLTQAKIDAQKKLIQESNRELTSLDAELAKKQKSIAESQRQIDTMQYYYGVLVRSAYKNRDPRVWYMYMLSGKDFAQNLRRVAYIRDMSRKMRVQARQIEEEKAQMEAERAQLVRIQAESRKLLAKRNSEMAALKATEADAQSKIKRLQADRKKYEKEIEKKRKQAEDLQAKARAAVASSGKTVKRGSVDEKLSGAFQANMGKLPWPVDGVVTEHFGQHYHPVYKNVKLPFNNGVNIAVAKDAEVVAVFEGTVRQVVVMPGYNKCVLVQHGEYYTFYCKLDTVKVKAGDKVRNGQKIGSVDTVAGATEFHFQLWKGTTPQDPEKWLK